MAWGLIENVRMAEGFGCLKLKRVNGGGFGKGENAPRWSLAIPGVVVIEMLGRVHSLSVWLRFGTGEPEEWRTDWVRQEL